MNTTDPRPLLVGISNPYAGRPGFSHVEALYPLPIGCTGHRVFSMLSEAGNFTRQQYLAAFARTNLDESDFRSKLERARTVVCLGATVWADLDLPSSVPLLGWAVEDRRRYCRVPHPSGRNYWYNRPSNRAAVGALLADLARGEEPWQRTEARTALQLS